MVEAKLLNAVGASLKVSTVSRQTPNPAKATKMDFKQGSKMSIFSFFKQRYLCFGMGQD